MKVLISLLLSVAVRTLISELSEMINNVDLEIVDSNMQNEVHSLQYWIEFLDDQPSDTLPLTNTQEQQETQHSRLLKYLQQPQEQQIQEIQQEEPQIIKETNPLKLMLLYGENTNVPQSNYSPELSNEQILQQMEKEKVEKIEKMQSLIIQELKDKKPEQPKQSSFLENDFVEWEMKTLTNNNRVR